jgi:hypothetical protein
VPGVERPPLKKLKTDEHALLALLERWRGEAVRSGYAIGVAGPVRRDRRQRPLKAKTGVRVP